MPSRTLASRLRRADGGPLRLRVPGDARAARGVRQLEAITVVVAP